MDCVVSGRRRCGDYKAYPAVAHMLAKVGMAGEPNLKEVKKEQKQRRRK
jgi:hypothetical protein